jgi:thymidylate synthase (FAD)
MEATEPHTTSPLRIVRDPHIYLVGRQTLESGQIDQFLQDHGVTWTTDTEVGGEALAEMAGRVCYMSYGKGRKTNREFLGHIVDVGHGSVLEHAVWSFVITGVSRSFTHELIRHRHFSYSQLSQRYVDESNSEFIEPDVIANDPELHAI